MMAMLSFLFVSNLSAHITDPVGGGSGRDSLDFDDLDEGIDIDSFYSLWPSVQIPEEEPVLNSEKHAIVIYDTYAVVFIKMDVNSERWDPNLSFLIQENGKTLMTQIFPNPSGEVVLTNNALDKEFLILSKNGTANPTTIGAFSTFDKRSYTGEVLLPQDRYWEVASYLENPNGVNLLDFISARPAWHMVEKIAFLQDFLYLVCSNRKKENHLRNTLHESRWYTDSS